MNSFAMMAGFQRTFPYAAAEKTDEYNEWRNILSESSDIRWV